MDLNRLRHFVTVAETLNFRRAAEQLHMAQPPLSVSIQKLEAELGMRLFERDTSGVSITPQDWLYWLKQNVRSFTPARSPRSRKAQCAERAGDYR